MIVDVFKDFFYLFESLNEWVNEWERQQERLNNLLPARSLPKKLRRPGQSQTEGRVRRQDLWDLDKFPGMVNGSGMISFLGWLMVLEWLMALEWKWKSWDLNWYPLGMPLFQAMVLPTTAQLWSLNIIELMVMVVMRLEQHVIYGCWDISGSIFLSSPENLRIRY